MTKRKPLILIIVLLFSLLTYLITFKDAYKEWDRIVSTDIDITENISKEIDNVIDNCFVLMNILGNISVQDDVTKILQQNPSISSFFIMDQKGNIKYEFYKDLDADEKTILFSVHILPYLQYPLKGEKYVSNLIQDRNLNHEMIAFGSPITNGDEISGIAFMTYKVNDFGPFLEEYKIGKKGYIAIRDGLGDTIYHPQHEKIRTKNYKFYDIPLVPKSDHRIVLSSLDNRPKYVTYKPLQNAPWMVFVLKPLLEYQSPIVLILLKNGTLLILLSIFLYLLFTLEKKEKRLLETQINNERLEVAAQVAAGIAHEIKNPLVPIKGFIQLEKYKAGSTLGQETIRLLLNEINRIEKIINEFLTLARIDKDEKVSVNIIETLKDVLALMSVEASSKEIVMKTNLDEIQETILVQGNKNHLIQIFQNIIKNSLEVEVKGGLIEILVKKDKKEVRISIKDNGHGMSAEQLRKIGTPFYSTKEQGTGMGVAICQRLVKNHGGRLNIVSQAGKGTTVEIYLPTI